MSDGPEAADLPVAPVPGGRVARRPPQRRGRRSGGIYSVLLRDSVLYGGGRVLQKFLSALLLPLYTSVLSPSDYGVLGLILVAISFIDAVVTLGFDVAFARFYFDEATPAHRNKVITNVFFIDTVYPSIVLGLLAVFAPQITRLILGQGHHYVLFFDLALLGEFFVNWSDLAFQVLRLDHRPYTYTAYTLARVFVQVPVTVLLVVPLHMGVLGVLLGSTITSFLILAAGLPIYFRRLTHRLSASLMRSMFAFAVPATFTGLIFFVLKLSDRFFLKHYQGNTEVGLYTVAFTISQPVYLAATAFRMAWPQWHYAKMYDPGLHKQMVARSSTYFMLVCTVMMVLQGVFMPLIVRVLGRNPAYWVVGPTTLLLTISTVVYSLYFCFWTGANVVKKNRLIPAITAVASAVNVGLNFIFVPRFGMLAAAATTVVGFAVLAGLMLPISQRYYSIPFEWLRLVEMFAVAALVMLAAWGLQRLTRESVGMPMAGLAWREALKLPLVAAYPAVLLLLGFFTPGETAAVRRLLRGGWRRPRSGGPGRTDDDQGPQPGPLEEREIEDAERDELELEASARLKISEGESPT